MVKEFEYAGKAMGTDYSVAIVCDSKELADKTYEQVKKDIHAYETRFSRFLPTSELSQLNKQRDMVVSETFLKVTTKAYQLFIETHGAFNPLMQIARFGYEKSRDDESYTPKNNIKESYDINFSTTMIDPKTRRIRLQEGQKLDFGGFLKGYLAEILAKKIESSSERITGVIVNLGGDIHTRGLDKGGFKFVFSIYNPILDNDETLVTLYNESLATSGTYKRSWLIDDKKIHHILDISGITNPDQDIVSASIIHADGATTEAYTKVLLSMDYDRAVQLLQKKHLSWLIIRNNGKVTQHIL